MQRTILTFAVISPLIIVLLLLLFVPKPSAWGQVYYWSTIAGRTDAGSANGINTNALFNNPVALVVDNANNIYVSDRDNETIRKIAPVGTNWVVTTIAGAAGQSGSTDGTNSNARFNLTTGLTVDSDGIIYVADSFNNCIRKLAPVGTNWVVTTIAGSILAQAGNRDGTNRVALFDFPNGIGVDGSGTLYVADGNNQTVRRILRSGTNWVTQTIAGSGAFGSADGTNLTAQFSYPSGSAPDSNGNVFVTDQNNSTIRKLAPDGTNWVVTTIAGVARTYGYADGTNTDARFNSPGGLAVDKGGNIYVADLDNFVIRKITPVGTNWVVSTIGGLYGARAPLTNGIGSAARFYYPNGVALDGRGNVYVADDGHNAIRRGIPLPVAQPVTVTDNTLTLTWIAAVGRLLQAQYTTDLGQTNWTNLGDQFVCTNSTITVRDSVISNPQRLYRLLVTP